VSRIAEISAVERQIPVEMSACLTNAHNDRNIPLYRTHANTLTCHKRKKAKLAPRLYLFYLRCHPLVLMAVVKRYSALVVKH
jgi:hypothetical protein